MIAESLISSHQSERAGSAGMVCRKGDCIGPFLPRDFWIEEHCPGNGSGDMAPCTLWEPSASPVQQRMPSGFLKRQGFWARDIEMAGVLVMMGAGNRTVSGFASKLPIDRRVFRVIFPGGLVPGDNSSSPFAKGFWTTMAFE